MEKLPSENSPKDSVQFLSSINPRFFDKTVLNAAWLEEQSKERLIRTIKILANRLLSDPTLEIKKSDLPLKTTKVVSSFKKPIAAVDEFIVPASMQDATKPPESLWVLELEVKDSTRQLLRVNILGDFTIGRKRTGSSVDLDLTPYNASHKGVSGRHAAIRVSTNNLYLYDLESLNGTLYNWKRLEPTSSVKLVEGEDVCFGKMVLVIRKIRKEY